MGWKPKDQDLSGAPIPLLYNFDQVEVKEMDPETGLLIEPLYLGARHATSTQMHKVFANLDRSGGCELQPNPSYKFEFPLVTQKPRNLKPHSKLAIEKQRTFTGMNPKLAK
jgi:hypothetical protein